MATMIGLPIVSSCSVDTCGYNHDGCRASAISVGTVSVGATAAGHHAHCNTFVDSEDKGGSADTASVGACSRTDCVHNTDMSCGAEAIEVGASFDVADCLTFAAR